MEHESLDRRRFLERAAVLLPAMHIGGFAASAAHGMTNDQAPATSPQPARIARLRLSSHAVPKMASFYRDTLGLPVAPIEGDRISVTCGETVIEFAPAPDGTQPFYHFAFNIPHNKLDKAIEWMKPRHPLFVRDDGDVVFHFERWDAHAVYFIDPSGNIVEFIARHTLKNDAPGSFDVGDILCASEIGVVTPDVDATADQLRRDLGLNNYKLASEAFCPVGDEHGLFIVFKVGRIWLASKHGTKVFPAHAHVRGELKAPIQIEQARFEVSPA
jgi:catechol-2,3-dioxygenase